MRYTDKEGNTLDMNKRMTADSFLMEQSCLYLRTAGNVFQPKRRAYSRKETEESS